MRITIPWVEVATSSKGTSFKKITVETEDGKKYDDAVVFPTYSKYNEVMPGVTLEGVLADGKEYRGRIGKILTDGNLGARPASMRSPAAITKAMEKKEASIEKFQDNKELSIKISSTLRMAVDLTIAEYPTREIPPAESIKKWREWLWINWDVDDKNMPPF